MPMPYWLANKGGLHAEVHRRATTTPVATLRRELPGQLAELADAEIPDAYAAWMLVQHGHPVNEVTGLLELDADTADALRAAAAAHPLAD